VAHTQNDSETVRGSQEAFKQMLHERLRQAVRVALISVLEEEVTAFIGALPYERTEQRRDQRNGHYRRDLETTMGQIADLPVPRTRGGYHTQVFERYHRRRDELDTAIGQMFVDGVSMAKVGQVVETLTGSKPSASTVSRVFHTLESEYQEWKQRQLEERYAFADGTYFTVIYNGQGCKMPILAVVGISTTGQREVLAFGVGDRENEQARTRPLRRSQSARGQSDWLMDQRWQQGHAQCHRCQIWEYSQAAVCDA
jgi:putative transposase